MKGMVTMLAEEKINKLIKEKKGIIQTSDAVNAGISKLALYKYLDKNNFNKVAHGIFVSPAVIPDPMYIISLRSKQVIFSHDSALYLQGMINNLPDKHTVTVKTGYNPTNLAAMGIKVFTIKSDFHDLGLTFTQNDSGHSLPTYNIERTICDIIRSRNDIDSSIFQKALKGYARRTDRDIKILMDYARKFRVDKILMKYLEVLL